MTDLRDAQKALNQLRINYASQLNVKIRLIEDTVHAILKNGSDKEMLRMLHRMAHGLTGSGATFGFKGISQSARSLETLLKSFLDCEAQIDTEQIHQFEVHLNSLKEASSHPDQNEEKVDLSKVRTFFPKESASNKKILLVDNDPLLAKDIALQIGCLGYKVQILSSLNRLKEAVEQYIPDAIIMDIVFPEGKLAGINIIQEIQAQCDVPMPVLFISSRDDFEGRLEAVKQGGSAYIHKPVDINSLVTQLDSLTSQNIEKPFRILIVEDDPILANYNAIILEMAGMETVVVNDPMEVTPPLNEFRPDLILMDVYMAKCNGMELAKVIRQQEAYISIPIVFLSTELRYDRHLDAMNLGADNVLIRPIKPDQLISIVASHVERARNLRRFMVRDSLTGLYNHAYLKEHLDIEIARTQREAGQMAYAMIDLDKFKTINDTYGHASGDRVVKSLSRFLQQRLRITDIIGRYSGDEFAVILPDTDGQVAYDIMEQIQKSFSKVRHHFKNEVFFSTLSCGIAVYPSCIDPLGLSQEADEALYQAKNGGGNRVIFRGDPSVNMVSPV